MKIKKIDQGSQTKTYKVFACRREETPLQDMRPKMNFEQRKVFKRAEVKVEEFILDQIGSFGIQKDTKRLQNCFLRNLIHSPQLFSYDNNKFKFNFEHRTKFLALYLGQRKEYLDFKRLIKNVFINRERY